MYFQVGGGENYSTEEQVVGTWIDGKKLYQKTVAVNLPTSDDNGVTWHGISDFGVLADLTLNWYDTEDKIWYANQRYYFDPQDSTQYDVGAFGVMVNENYVVISRIGVAIDWSKRNENAYITIRYTKTTN